MISICIPVYNYNIDDLIDQLLQQCALQKEYTEILIYDDSSTEDINLNFIDELVTTYYGKENMGSVESRKFLANKSQNKWILFLDADLELPNQDFLANYFSVIKNNADLYYGGVIYNEREPDPEKILRWKYGHRKETRIPKSSEDIYTHFISCSYLINQKTFNTIFTNSTIKGYGQDIYLSLLLKQYRINVEYINNPVIHLGLETSEVYLKKSLEGIETTFNAEQKGLIPDNYRPVQRAYLKLKRTKSLKLFIGIIKSREKIIRKNLLSTNPKLIYLDFIKLYHYSRLKQKD